MAKQYGNFTDFISVARASSGTCLRKVKFGPNLVANGDFRRSVDGWTGADCTISSVGGQMEISYTATTQWAYTSIPTEAGKVYRATVYARSDNAVLWGLQAEDSVFGGTILKFREETTLTSDLVAKTITFVAQSDTVVLEVFTRLTSGTAYVDNVTVEECQLDHKDGELILFNHPENVARVEYDEYGRVIGTLIEEARTNLLTQSQDFMAWDNVWAGGITLTTNAALGIDGNLSLNKLARIDANSDGINDVVTLSASTEYCVSAFWKAGDANRSRLEVWDSNAGSSLARVDFDWTAGVPTTFSSSNASNISYEHWGNGIYRVSFACTTAATVTTHQFILAPEKNGSGTEYAYAQFPQLEAGSFPTSYIPTSGATATRSADIASISVDNFGYNPKAGSVVVEFNAANWANETSTNYSGIWDFYGNIGSNADGVFRGVTTGAVRYRFNEDDSTTAALGAAELDIPSDTGFDKVAVGLKSGSNYIIMNGGTSATGTGTAATNLYSTLQIGQRASGGNYINGHIKSIKYYPRRLTNTQLQEQTA